MIIGSKNEAVALLKHAITSLDERKKRRETRWNCYLGKAEKLPAAPEGASTEYQELREMSPLPLIRLAVRTPAQRLRIKGMQTSSEEIAKRHRAIWQRNRMDSQQRVPYVHAMVYSTGIKSVWPNEKEPDLPIVRHEDPNITWLEFDPDDPLAVAWSAKHFTRKGFDSDGKPTEQRVGFVYDDEQAWKFEMEPRLGVNGSGAFVNQNWDNATLTKIAHPLQDNPMTPFMADLDAGGNGYSLVEPLMPMQRAIDTMRYDLLLAAQYAAYRQRVATNYDPIVRDKDGNPIWSVYPVGHLQEGQPVLDPVTGQRIPLISSPGRVGVDRLLAFPGDTKIFDLAESNLENYVTALNMLIGSFASTAQVPPQYLVGDFKNVSGDLMVATEATLRSLIKDLQTSFGESEEAVAVKVGRATGDPAMVDYEAETVWEETGPISLSQIGQFASQMVPLGFPFRQVVEMVPGISQAQAASMDLTPPAPPAPATPPSGPGAATPPAGEPSGDTPTPGEPGDGERP